MQQGWIEVAGAVLHVCLLRCCTAKLCQASHRVGLRGQALGQAGGGALEAVKAAPGLPVTQPSALLDLGMWLSPWTGAQPRVRVRIRVRGLRKSEPYSKKGTWKILPKQNKVCYQCLLMRSLWPGTEVSQGTTRLTRHSVSTYTC